MTIAARLDRCDEVIESSVMSHKAGTCRSPHRMSVLGTRGRVAACFYEYMPQHEHPFGHAAQSGGPLGHVYSFMAREPALNVLMRGSPCSGPAATPGCVSA